MTLPLGRTAGAAVASAAATAVLAAALGLAAAAADAVLGPLLGAVPVGEISVGPPVFPFGPLALQTGRRVDAALEARLAADTRVRTVSAEVPLRVPARVEGALFGRIYTSDVAAVGTDARFLGLPPGTDFEAPSDGPVPVVFSGALLDLYNTSFASAHRLPRLTEAFLVGRGFDFIAGESSIFGASPDHPALHRRARMVAFSDRPGLIGLAFPRAYVEGLNRSYGASIDPERLWLAATDAEAAAALARELRAEGFAAETSDEAAAAAARLARAAAAAIGLLAAGTAGVAAFGLGAAAAATALERRAEADLYHLLAWPRLRIIAALAAGTAFAGALGAAAGAAGGAWAAMEAWARLGERFGIAAAPEPMVRAAAAAALLVAVAGALAAFAAAAGVVPRWRRR